MEKLNKIFRMADVPFLDRYTVEHEPVSSADLMERSAGCWCKVFLEKFGTNHRVVVIAGSGNNGGDGYVIARLLKEAGADVCVYRVFAAEKRSADCELNYRRWLAMGGVIRGMEEWEVAEEDVIVDAIFGSGLNRKVCGVAAEAIRKIRQSGCLVVAVDIPSGLMGEDNGDNDRDVIVKAAYTLTFQFPKLAFLLAENAPYVGEWQVLDIGLHPRAIQEKDTPYYYTTEAEVRSSLPRPEKFAHKGTNGRGLFIAGRFGMMGAAVLAARAASRSGTGLLYTHIPRKGIDILQTAVPEAIPVVDRSEVCFSASGKLDLYDAIAVGPAIGKAPETAAALRDLLQHWHGPAILDADALNILAEHREWLELLHEKCLLTPHVKEFERLAGKSKNDFDRLNKLSTFASRYHTYIILKGAYSVVATPEGKLFFNMSGNPGMAKGGSGDVLTGVLLGLAANGLEMEDVARAGVFAHGLAGDLAATESGYRGVCAGEIVENLGKAWKRLKN